LAGIVRTIYLGQAYGSNPDKTWIAFNVVAAGTAEGYLAIICACAPSLRSFFRTYFKDLTVVESRTNESHDCDTFDTSNSTPLATIQKSLPTSRTDLTIAKKPRENEKQDLSPPENRITSPAFALSNPNTQPERLPSSPAFGWLDIMCDTVSRDSDGVPSESFFLSDNSDDYDEELDIEDIEDDMVELTRT
jgi:hypothetical protein